MTVIDPDTYASMIRFEVESADLLKPRSLLTDSGHIGMSSLHCREEVRRILTKTPASDSPARWKAIIGTALDEQFEQALRAAHPEWVFKVNVTATLPSGTRISGTCDWADPTEPSVTDLKSKDGLAYARKSWATQRSYRYQRHLLYLGMVQEHDYPTDGIVRNVVVDRSGREAHPFVWAEPFSMDVVREADEWLADVFYAIDHGEEAPKDAEGHECTFCPFYTACRGSAIVSGPITTPRLAEAVDSYGEAKAQRDEAQAVMDELRPTVSGVTGYTERYSITSTTVASNGSTRITVRPR